MGETPVTQAQFDVWTKSHQIEHAHHFSGNPAHPAENMTWHQATDYCRWLTDTHVSRFPHGFQFAELPCEAAWEYACRAGSSTDYHTGDGDAALLEAGWYGEDYLTGTTHPCGRKRANRFGLSDMHGNVWEWCLDRWDASAYRRRWDGITDVDTYRLSEEFGDRELYGFPDPRVLRGGSYWVTAFGCRSACRNGNGAGGRAGFDGFRVCLVRSPFFSQTAEAEPERTALERRDAATGAGSDGEAEILNPSSPGSARGRTAPEAPPPQPCPNP